MGFYHRKWRGLSEKNKQRQHEYALRYQARLARLHQQNTCPKCGQAKTPKSKTCMACRWEGTQHKYERDAAHHLLTRPLQPGERVRIQDGHLQVLSGGRIFDLTPLGLGEIAYNLHASFGFAYEDIGPRLHLSLMTTYKYARLAIYLPDKAKKMLRSGTLSLQKATILTKLRNKAKVSWILRSYPAATEDDLFIYVEKFLSRTNQPESENSPDPRDTLAGQIEDLLGKS